MAPSHLSVREMREDEKPLVLEMLKVRAISSATEPGGVGRRVPLGVGGGTLERGWGQNGGTNELGRGGDRIRGTREPGRGRGGIPSGFSHPPEPAVTMESSLLLLRLFQSWTLLSLVPSP